MRALEWPTTGFSTHMVGCFVNITVRWDDPIVIRSSAGTDLP